MPIPAIITRMPSEVLVCIDDRFLNSISGRIYTLYSKEGYEYSDLSDFFEYLHEFFDAIDFPQRQISLRSFGEKDRKKFDFADCKKERSHEDLYKLQGELFSIYLVVNSQGGATWQGQFYVKELDKTYNFKNELELIRIMNEI